MRLSLYYPVKPFHVNQHWGDNIPCVKDFGLSTQVVVNGADNTTCPVGFTKLYPEWGMNGHNGTDLQAGEQPVYAAYGGTVIEQQLVPSRGLGLGILSDSPVDLDTTGTHFIKLRYWHLKSFAVAVGDHVAPGQQIGISNNTGYSSGDHLHFEGDPMDKDAGGHPYPYPTPQEIAGSINLEPFFNGLYAEDLAPDLAPHYTFMVNLAFGQTSVDIAHLQETLMQQGCFPTSQAATGYYGPITASAVLAFRSKYGISSATDPLGHSVGPLTRSALNSLYNGIKN